MSTRGVWIRIRCQELSRGAVKKQHGYRSFRLGIRHQTRLNIVQDPENDRMKRETLGLLCPQSSHPLSYEPFQGSYQSFLWLFFGCLLVEIEIKTHYRSCFFLVFTSTPYTETVLVTATLLHGLQSSESHFIFRGHDVLCIFNNTNPGVLYLIHIHKNTENLSYMFIISDLYL
jgi:hypothetical protein